MEDAITILQAVLTIIGGLKIISRYTPWKWDDQVLSILESPIPFIKSLFKK